MDERDTMKYDVQAKSPDYISMQKRALRNIDGSHVDGVWIVRFFKWLFRIRSQ